MTLSSPVPGTLAPLKCDGIQYAALPYRIVGDTLEILLVTSRRNHRWIIPKGWPIEGLTPQATAAREAMEEAGIAGEIGDVPIGHFQYQKRFKMGIDLPCKVDVFTLLVTKEEDDWAEKDARERRWCTVEVASAIVDEPELQRLIANFGARMAGTVRTAD